VPYGRKNFESRTGLGVSERLNGNVFSRCLKVGISDDDAMTSQPDVPHHVSCGDSEGARSPTVAQRAGGMSSSSVEAERSRRPSVDSACLSHGAVLRYGMRSCAVLATQD